MRRANGNGDDTASIHSSVQSPGGDGSAPRRPHDPIAISTGSACSSATAEPSKVLLALGLDPEVAASGVRISLGRFTTDDDVREACRVLTALPAGTVELPA